jgi:hypothetical protein
MDILRKIFAIFVMICAAIGLLLCAGGLIGAWAANGPLTDLTTGTLGALENYLGIADQAAQTAAAGLGDAQQGVDRINQSVAGLTNEDKTQAAAAIKRTAEETVGPTITRARDTLSFIGSTVVQFNATLESVNRVPGVRVPTLTDELQAAGARLDQAQAAAGEIASAAADAATLDGSRITAATAKMSSELQAAQTAIGQGQARIQATNAAIASAKMSLPGLIDMISLVGSLLFILFGAGQICLLYVAWQWFKRPAKS